MPNKCNPLLTSHGFVRRLVAAGFNRSITPHSSRRAAIPPSLEINFDIHEKSWSAFDLWEEFQKKHSIPNFSAKVELQHARHAGLDAARRCGFGQGRGRIGPERIRDSLARSKNRPVLDLNKLHWNKTDDLRPLCEKLSAYRSRIRVVLPKLSAAHSKLLLIASMFHHY